MLDAQRPIVPSGWCRRRAPQKMRGNILVSWRTATFFFWVYRATAWSRKTQRRKGQLDSWFSINIHQYATSWNRRKSSLGVHEVYTGGSRIIPTQLIQICDNPMYCLKHTPISQVLFQSLILNSVNLKKFTSNIHDGLQFVQTSTEPPVRQTVCMGGVTLRRSWFASECGVTRQTLLKMFWEFLCKVFRISSIHSEHTGET